VVTVPESGAGASTSGTPGVRPLTRIERVRAGVAYWLLVVALLAFSAAGWFLVYAQGKPARIAKAVPARIESVQVLSVKDARGHSTKRPIIIYSYSVGDVRYTSDRIMSLAEPHSASWAERMAQRFHVGQAVTAYITPLDPGSAFLIQERDWRTYAFGVVPLILALALAIYWPWAGIRDTAHT
jgi:Protein of unknown function (DUF3592)